MASTQLHKPGCQHHHNAVKKERQELKTACLLACYQSMMHCHNLMCRTTPLANAAFLPACLPARCRACQVAPPAT
jgi:hypothetical protein